MADASNGSLKRQDEGSCDDEPREMSVTLLRHSGTKRVLYMEAGKDFVDLLLSFLLLPVGTIVKRLAETSVSTLGAIENVAGSVAKLDNSCLYVHKSVLLTPEVSLGSNEHLSRASLLQLKVSSEPYEDEGDCFYSCDGSITGSTWSNLNRVDCLWRTGRKNATCPHCASLMSREVWMKVINREPANRNSIRRTGASKPAKTGFVKKNVTFIVTDDLEISPASTIKSINLLNNLKVASMSELESCETRVGAQEALKLLGASFTSTNVLNDVFGPRVIVSE